MIPTKQVTIFPNNKPWVTKDLKGVLNKKKRTFYQGTVEERKQVNQEVKAAVRRAKQTYKNKVESKFAGGDFRTAWQGIKSMAGLTTSDSRNRSHIKLQGVSDDNLPNDMNRFFTRFETRDFSLDTADVRLSLYLCTDIVIDQETVGRYLKATKVNKSPGPDGICGRTLRFCADQLSGVFRDIFQSSVDTATVPTIWKTSTIIPIQKKTNPKELNDFRPVALTSLVMKTLEKIIKSLIMSATEQKLDPLQFAYRAGRGVDDAKLFILNKLYSHLEKSHAHARILFADFSSAFNLMQPYVLAKKLMTDFHLCDQLTAWIIDFLSFCPQSVSVNGHVSNVIVTNTGSPQGCVLSPLLYILYTDNCRSRYEDRFLVKFADDSALISLLSGSENDHGDVLQEFVNWCDDSYLELNVLKTKELIVDFRKKVRDAPKTVIHGQEVEIVSEYKYLGTIFDDKLKWDVNTCTVVKKCQQ